MKIILNQFFTELMTSHSDTFEERRSRLKALMILAACFFIPYYLLIIIPLYGFQSLLFQIDMLGGSFIIIGFLFAIPISKYVEHDFVLILPALGSFGASILFLSHHEFFLQKPYLWNYAQLISMTFGIALISLRNYLILIAINLLGPLLVAYELDHIIFSEVLQRQSLATFVAFLSTYFVYRSQIQNKDLLLKAKETEVLRQSSELGTWQWNLKTGEVSYDERWKEILGYDSQELAPNLATWQSLTHPDDRIKAEAATKLYLEGSNPLYEVKFRMKHKDGHWVPIIAKGKVIKHNPDGSPYIFAGTHFDFTFLEQLQKNLEEEKIKLIHASKLASLGTMAAGVAHEILNPLNIIKNASIVLEKGENPQEKEKMADSIKRSVSRIDRIVSGLKRFCRTSDEFSRKEINLRNVIDETINLTSTYAKSHDVKLITKDIFDYNYFCDELEIEQVLINLINNSIDENAGKENAWVEVSMKLNSESIQILIKDSGNEIAKNIQENLFIPFFTTKDVNKGTGLGLSISQSIIKDHNGELFYQSLDKHPCFTIKLPLLS